MEERLGFVVPANPSVISPLLPAANVGLSIILRSVLDLQILKCMMNVVDKPG